MRSEQRSITLNIYLESSRLHEPDHDAESPVPRLTFQNVAHPEWAVHALRRTMHVQNVVDFGISKNDPTQYGITVFYRHEQVSDMSTFKAMIRMVIGNAGISIPHL